MNSFWTDARPAPAASSLPALLGAPALRPAFLEKDSRGPAANCVTRETLGSTTARPPGCSPLCALASGRTGIPVEWSEEHVKEHTSRTWPSAQHTAALGHAADTCAGLPDSASAGSVTSPGRAPGAGSHRPASVRQVTLCATLCVPVRTGDLASRGPGCSHRAQHQVARGSPAPSAHLETLICVPRGATKEVMYP